MCDRKISTEFYGVLQCDRSHAGPGEQHRAFHPGGDVECNVKGPHPIHGGDGTQLVGKNEPHVFHDLPEFKILWFTELPPTPSHLVNLGPAARSSGR